jgi:hypothetical protein
MKGDPHIYGVLAEFDDPQAVLAAAKRARAEGYRMMDAYTPFPIHGLSDAIGFHKTRLPLIVLIGGVIGCVGGYLMQWYANVVAYPINIAGRPYNSWPAWIPITFEMTVLCAGLAAVLGMLALNGLPTPYHPLFNMPRFELASRTHFFFCIKSTDPKFDAHATRVFLLSMRPTSLALVPRGRVEPSIPVDPRQPGNIEEPHN